MIWTRVTIIAIAIFCLCGCDSTPSRKKSRLEVWIDGCGQRNPPWTNQEKARLIKATARKRDMVWKAIQSNPELKHARVKTNIYPQAIHAGCVDAVSVEVVGFVSSVAKKRKLTRICIKYDAINIDGILIPVSGGNDVGVG